MSYKKLISTIILSSIFSLGNCVFANNTNSVINSNNDDSFSPLNIYYINDTHGELINLGKLITELNKIKKSENSETTLISTQGDMYIGRNHKRNSAMTKLLNIAGVELFTLGNHEFDDGSAQLAKELGKGNFVTVMTNMNIPDGNPLNTLTKENKLFSSYILTKNGEKYGIIGAAPIGVNLGLFDKDNQVSVYDSQKTILNLNNEVKKLEEQGVNKIILVSHLGYFGDGGDLEIAKQTEGIDVILGGHTHLEIDGIQSHDIDKTHLTNLVKSKRGEPVVIVQTNGAAHDIGNLKISFNTNGVIITDGSKNIICNSHIRIDKNAPTDKTIQKITEKALGVNKVVAVAKTPFVSSGTTEERNLENPTANLLCDAAFYASKGKNPDVVLVHSPTVRGGLVGEITTYQVKYSMLPFNGQMFYAELTEKDFVNLLNTEALTSMTTDNSQMIQVHGMRYVVDKTVKNPQNSDTICVKDIVLVDKNNNVVRKIDSNNPSVQSTVKCVIAGYLFLDKRTKSILTNAKNIQFIGKEQDIVLKYLKKHKEINAIREGRVTVIEK